jgi:peptide/nickel transport system substrate-binding protein
MSQNKRLIVLWIVLVFAALPLVVNAQSPDENTLVIAQSVDVNTLDPALVGATTEANIVAHMFATLYEITEAGTLSPYLADSYTISEDGTEWTFTLKEGLTCHDGSPLTAEDVAYTFNRAADPANAFTGNTTGFVLPSTGFVEARADGELEATIVTTMRQSENLRLGLLSEVYILCEEPYAAMTLDEAAATPVGSGPYRFVEWVRDDHVLMEKVEDFGLREANFQQILWRVIPESSTRTAELIAGNVDIISNVPPDQIAAINNSTTATVKAVSGTRRIYVGFQQGEQFEGQPGFAEIQNPMVRQAMNMAVDVPTICITLLGVECDRMATMVNPPMGNPDIEAFPYDPAQAEALLDEAGYPRGEDGVRFEITLQGGRGRYLNDANVIQAIGQYLTDVGVQTNIEILDWTSEFVPLIREKNAGPLFFLGTGGSTWSALYDMTGLSTQEAGTNYSDWKNDEWFGLWEDLANVTTQEEEDAIVDQLLQIMHDDAPWLFLYFQPDFYAVSNRINWEPRRDEDIIVYSATLAE